MLSHHSCSQLCLSVNIAKCYREIRVGLNTEQQNIIYILATIV